MKHLYRDSGTLEDRGWRRSRAVTYLLVGLLLYLLPGGLRAYLAWCESTGAPTLGFLAPFVDSLISFGSYSVVALSSKLTWLGFAIAFAIAVAHWFAREKPPWRHIVPPVAFITLLFSAFVAKSLRQTFVAFSLSISAALLVPFCRGLWGGRLRAPLPRRYLVPAAILVSVLTLITRCYGLAQHPAGFPEHAVVHNLLALDYYKRLLPPAPIDWRGLWNSIMVHFGLQSLLEALSFSLIGFGLLQSMALPVFLGIGAVALAYFVGRELLGPRVGIAFAYLTAASSWQIAFARYGDPEHILPIFQLTLTLLLTATAFRRRSAVLGFLAGLTLASTWFVYGTNQIIPVILVVFLGFLLVSRPALIQSHLKPGLALLVGFLLISGDPIFRSVRAGHLFPIRVALPDNANYQIASVASVPASISKALEILIHNVDDAWFTKEGGALSDLEAILLLPALVLAVQSIRLGRARVTWCFLLSAFLLSTLPGIASLDVSVRRLMLTAYFSTLIVAGVLPDVWELLASLVSPRALRIAVALLLPLFACTALHAYFVETKQPHSASHESDTGVARFVVQHAPHRPTKAFAHDEGDAHLLYHYIKLAGYDVLKGVRGRDEQELLRYTVYPEALSKELTCSSGGYIVLRREDEPLFISSVKKAPAIAREIDWNSRVEYPSSAGPPMLVSFEVPWCR